MKLLDSIGDTLGSLDRINRKLLSIGDKVSRTIDRLAPTSLDLRRKLQGLQQRQRVRKAHPCRPVTPACDDYSSSGEDGLPDPIDDFPEPVLEEAAAGAAGRAADIDLIRPDSFFEATITPEMRREIAAARPKDWEPHPKPASDRIRPSSKDTPEPTTEVPDPIELTPEMRRQIAAARQWGKE
jgi:hypothetical protein